MPRRLYVMALAACSALAAPAATARADGYCDLVEGVASSESALLFAPEVFASYGYLDQGVIVTIPEASGDDARLTAGVAYRLSGILEGMAVKSRARADCQRHLALSRLQRATVYRGLAARARILDDAVERADRILEMIDRDFKQRRATAQEVTATRLRVDEIRAMAAATRGEIVRLGSVKGGGETGGAIRDYYLADDEMQKQEGRLRRLQAFDVSVRAGYDAFTGPIDDDENPLFAVVSVGINLGALFQGSGEERAAAGRRRYVREERSSASEPSVRELRLLAEQEKQRAEQTAVLVEDLERQLADLKDVGGETGRRYRETVWFELVKIKAEHEYHKAYAAGLAELAGERASE
jgi:hypothetical protein